MSNEEILKKNSARRQKCQVWTRVMGYHRVIDGFNIGKKGEHKQRKHFIEPSVV